MQTGNCPFTYRWEYIFYCLFTVCFYRLVMTNTLDWCLHNYCFDSVLFLFFFLLNVAGRRTVLVHHQTGIAAITVTALEYQASHLTAANVPSPVSENSSSTTVTSKNCFSLPL